MKTCFGALAAVVVLCACSSSDTTNDGSPGDVGRDVATGDTTSVCAEGAPCEEACLDAKAKEPPLFAWTSTWNLSSSNAGLVTQITMEPRRCQWSSLTEQCTVYNCLADEWSGGAATMKGVSAGQVTIEKGGAKDAVLSPDADGVYLNEVWSTAHWAAGDKISITAQGATVQAFSLAVDFPTPLAATDPLGADAGGAREIERGVSLTFTWTPTDEKVIAMLAQQPAKASPLWDRRELWCVFDGAAGTGTVPPEVLKHLSTDLRITGYGIAHYRRRCYAIGEHHVQASGANGSWWTATGVR
jgi:hypothetical protein